MATHATRTHDQAGDLQLRVVSVGFGHGPAPVGADLVIDLREWFRDPHVSPEMRELTGRDYAVIANVLSTPGMVAFIDRVFAAVGELVGLGLKTVTVVVGCVGGRHRSVVAADQLFFRARAAGWSAEVVHRDLALPVLTSRREAGAADLAAVGYAVST